METTGNRSNFIVKTSAANMPGSCWGVYRRVAVLEVEPHIRREQDVAMISERARGVRRIVDTWEKLNVGTTERCAYRRALAEAEKMIEKLKGGG